MSELPGKPGSDTPAAAERLQPPVHPVVEVLRANRDLFPAIIGKADEMMSQVDTAFTPTELALEKDIREGARIIRIENERNNYIDKELISPISEVVEASEDTETFMDKLQQIDYDLEVDDFTPIAEEIENMSIGYPYLKDKFYFAIAASWIVRDIPDKHPSISWRNFPASAIISDKSAKMFYAQDREGVTRVSSKVKDFIQKTHQYKSLERGKGPTEEYANTWDTIAGQLNWSIPKIPKSLERIVPDLAPIYEQHRGILEDYYGEDETQAMMADVAANKKTLDSANLDKLAEKRRQLEETPPQVVTHTKDTLESFLEQNPDFANLREQGIMFVLDGDVTDGEPQSKQVTIYAVAESRTIYADQIEEKVSELSSQMEAYWNRNPNSLFHNKPLYLSDYRYFPEVLQRVPGEEPLGDLFNLIKGVPLLPDDKDKVQDLRANAIEVAQSNPLLCAVTNYELQEFLDRE